MMGLTSRLTYDVSGSFTYDADTGVFSNANLVNVQTIITKYGTSIQQYGSAATSITGSANQISFFAGGGFTLSFASTLTNAGGAIVLTSGTLGNCCLLKADQTITGVPQTPKATAVPEPEAYAMMLAGLGLVGFAARRKLS